MHLTLWTWVFPVAFHTSGILCCFADLCNCWCMLLLCIKHKQLRLCSSYRKKVLMLTAALLTEHETTLSLLWWLILNRVFFFDEMCNEACPWNAKSWIIFFTVNTFASLSSVVCADNFTTCFPPGILHFQVKIHFLFLLYYKHIYYLVRFQILGGCKYYDYKRWNVTLYIFVNWYRFCGNLLPTCFRVGEPFKGSQLRLGRSYHRLRSRICYIYAWFVLTAYFLSWKWIPHIITKRWNVPTTRHYYYYYYYYCFYYHHCYLLSPLCRYLQLYAWNTTCL